MRWVYISDLGERSGHRFLSIFKFSQNSVNLQTQIFMAEEELVQVEEGPLPFPPEWDARYPRHGQTGADAPPGYITLFEDFFLEGNFRLPATEFMASILHFYGFHTSQMSPAGMVRVSHFEFLCRYQGMDPTA
ncbi:hypothetical protein Hanom_Chr03g00235481 [Helianthus anomalus]